MRIAFFSATAYDIKAFKAAAKDEGVTPKDEIIYYPEQLCEKTVSFAEGCEGICIIANDTADATVLRKLHAQGTKVLFLRCAGFDMVDRAVANELDLPLLRVPAYSPYSVAEGAATLMMCLNRKVHIAFNRTRELNFDLNGLLGMDIHGKTIGIIGTGKIGAIFARISAGFGANVIGYDVVENPEAKSYGLKYVTLDEIWEQSDIISLHCPLFPSTKHTINAESISKMKKGVMIINAARGALVDIPALVDGLKSGQVGSAGLDVLEGESDYFFANHSGEIIKDDSMARLFTFPNVLITGHQAWFTHEAEYNIAKTTMDNIKAYEAKGELKNRV